MAGELDLVTEDELAAYGARIMHEHAAEAHFYADNGKVAEANFSAIANIGVEIA